MRTATLPMPDETSRAVDRLLDRLRREAGSAPGRFEFLSAVFARALPAELAAENDRLDALAAATDQAAQEAREKAQSEAAGRTDAKAPARPADAA